MVHDPSPANAPLFRLSTFLVSITLASVSRASSAPHPEPIGDPFAESEIYQLPKNSPLRSRARAVALIVKTTGSAPGLTQDPQDPSVYRLHTSDWIEASVPDPANPLSSLHVDLCAETPFRGQQVVGRSTAFLVGDDLVMMAEHSVSSGFCENFAFVFDFHQVSPTNPPSLAAGTGYPGYLEIPEDRVRFCAHVVHADAENDWALIRITEPVSPDRVPLRIRRRGRLPVGSDVDILGHANHLPLKLDRGSFESSGPLQAARGVSLIGVGSSGSPWISSEEGLVEGILRGSSSSTLVLDPQGGGCGRFCVLLDDPCIVRGSGFPFLQGLQGNEAVLDLVAPIGLRVEAKTDIGAVDPLATLDHLGPTGGPMTNEETIYELTADGSRDVEYGVIQETSAPVPVFLIDGAEGEVQGLLGAGSSTQHRLKLHPGILEHPGIWEVSLEFRDRTHAAIERRRHRVAVDFESFRILPDDDFDGDGPGARPGDSSVFLVENRYAVPIRVRVDPVPGFPGETLPPRIKSPATFMIPALESRTFELEYPFDASFYGGRQPGVYFGAVELSRLGAPYDFKGVPSRLDLDRRIEAFSGTPGKVSAIAPTLFEVAVSSKDKVGDVDLDLLIQLDPGFDAQGLLVHLISPSLTESLVFDGTRGGVQPQVVDRVLDDDTPLDDETTSPSIPLSIFDGEPMEGTWALRVEWVDQPLPVSGTLVEAHLRLHPDVPDPFQ